MAKGILPKPGTVLSVEWQEIGPLLKVEGDAIGLIVSLWIIAGTLNKNCNIPIDVMTYAVSHGRELIDALSAHSVTFDMHELQRQAAEMAKEDEHEDT